MTTSLDNINKSFAFFNKMHSTPPLDVHAYLHDWHGNYLANLYMKHVTKSKTPQEVALMFYIYHMTTDGQATMYYHIMDKIPMLYDVNLKNAEFFYYHMQRCLFRKSYKFQENILPTNVGPLCLPNVLTDIVNEYIPKNFIHLYPVLNEQDKLGLLKWHNENMKRNIY